MEDHNRKVFGGIPRALEAADQRNCHLRATPNPHIGPFCSPDSLNCTNDTLTAVTGFAFPRTKAIMNSGRVSRPEN